jgi:squalene synthase HpnC
VTSEPVAAGHLMPAEYVRRPALMERRWARADALAYTRWLAANHYENFHVVSVLLPRHLHQDFYNVYAFCRWADDLSDEIGDRAESLRLLGWWRGELEAMYEGRTQHPVFVALEGTAKKYELEPALFRALIRAFEQDQVVSRYETWEKLFCYCRNSANPVGRLVLRLCGYRDPERDRMSDATCTALQLANFWQDVPVDLEKGRIYLPLEVMRKHGCTEEDLMARRFTPGFREAMREAVGVARVFFERGLPLVGTVDRRLALDLDLFSRGGMRVLEKIERQDYNVLERRPVIGKTERALLLVRSLVRVAFSRAA